MSALPVMTQIDTAPPEHLTIRCGRQAKNRNENNGIF
jgi:hypothetical protein